MLGIPELLGSSLGTMMGNPQILVAGLIVSRNSPRTPRFWVELGLAMVVCTAIQFTFDEALSDLPSHFSLGHWFVLVTLATVWATLIFLGTRSLRQRFRRPAIR